MDFLSSQGFVSAPQLDHLIILFLYKFSAWPGWLSSHVWSWLLGVWPSWGLIALAGAHRIWEPQCDRNWTMQSVYFFVQMFMMGTWRGVGFLFACMLFEQFKHAWYAFTIERSKAGAGMHRCYCCSWSFLVEQPRQTHLFNHFRWQWFQEKICYVPCLLCMCFQAVVEPIMHDFWFDNDFC